MLYWQQIRVVMSCDGMPLPALHSVSSHSLEFCINDLQLVLCTFPNSLVETLLLLLINIDSC